MEELLIKSLKRIMSLKDGIHAHAYQIGDFIEISVDDLDFYFNDKSFQQIWPVKL